MFWVGFIGGLVIGLACALLVFLFAANTKPRLPWH